MVEIRRRILAFHVSVVALLHALLLHSEPLVVQALQPPSLHLSKQAKKGILAKMSSQVSTCNAVVAAPRAVLLQNISLKVLYEDADVLAIRKPAGMAVQYSNNCVENAVTFYLNNTADSNYYGAFGVASLWPWKSPTSFQGMVHRLDKGTSGILVLAKHPQAASALKLAFEERRVQKTYLAIAEESYPVTNRMPTQSDSVTAASFPQEEEPTLEQKQLSKAIKNCGRNHTQALQMLQDASSPSASCYSASISVCRRAGERDLAISLLYSQLPPPPRSKTTGSGCAGVRPNLLAFKTILSLCALDRPLCDTALDIVWHQMPLCGLGWHPHCVSSAIVACGRDGRLADAMQLLEMMEQQDDGVHSCCRQAAMKACERCGDVDQAQELLMRQQEDEWGDQRDNRIHKQPFVAGIPITVDAPIGKIGPRRMGLQSMDEGGRYAHTVVTPLALRTGRSYHRIVIATGRTHQIRVHMAEFLGRPLVGDTVYGSYRNVKHRPMLHAAEITIPHPMTGKAIHLTCRPPADFEALAIQIMGKDDYHQSNWGLSKYSLKPN